MGMGKGGREERTAQRRPLHRAQHDTVRWRKRLTTCDTLNNAFLRACNARQQMIIGPLSSLCESSQGSLYRPEKHGNIGN